MERRLAAILVADVVGSTAAMEADEEAAVTRCARCLDALADIVRQQGGRVFNTAGDSLLAEFPSPVNALRAAMDGRAAIANLDGAGPQDMRFGLHLADVLAVDQDLRGDGVNLAARIQSQADPGEIDVSGVLYDQVRRISPCMFEDLGPRSFKGISEPIRVLRVQGAMERHRFHLGHTRPAAAPVRHPNSVAVLPFQTSSSADEDQTFLADGLTDDLTLELSRMRRLFVSSRTAAADLETGDPVEIGRRLGVHYVLKGSVRRLGPRIRLNISVVETEHGSVVWSDRIQRPFEEVLDLLDEITARVAATVCGRIEDAELAAARLKRPENMSAYESYLRGVDHHRLGGVLDHHVLEAMRYFEQAMAADPTFGRPHAMYVCAWSYLPDFDWDTAARRTTRAMELDPTNPDAHRIMGVIVLHRGDFAAARYHHERAMELAPNDAYIIGRCAAFYVFSGETERALEMLDRAEELDPFLPVWVTEERVAANYVLERWEAALTAARTLPFQTRRTRLYAAAAAIALGQIDQARQMVRDAVADAPDLS
ncbi:MAG: tetratricopeptide repeat protein, partial [Rhodospirillaceae bacterium]|nr:tetratricopeptide repeat protein [Rhodospirillaceae bacterium]